MPIASRKEEEHREAQEEKSSEHVNLETPWYNNVVIGIHSQEAV